MTKPEIKERLTAIVVERLNVKPEQCTDEARFHNDLNADSLDLVEVIMDCESEKGFGITIPDNDADKINTFGELVDYIENNQ